MSPWSLTATPLAAGDALLCAAALGVMAVIARRCGRAQPSARQAFLAGGQIPWWAAGLSLAATEISALTLIAVPAAVCGGDWGYGQFFAGSLAGRLLAAGVFLPALAQGGHLTCYGWLTARFGAMSGRLAAALYCGAKLLGAGLRLLAAALAASLLTGLGPGWCALILCAAAAVYIGYGGLRAVVWTGVWQAAVIAAAAAVVGAYILQQIPGSVHGALRLAEEGGRLRFWHPAPAWGSADAWRRWLSSPEIFWVASLNGLAGSLAAFGADHDFTQKLMACRGPREARRALALATAASAAALAVLLSLGTLLYAFYRAHPALAVPEPLDQVFPHFAATVLPSPLRGLALAGLLLAAVDLPLSSLSAVSACDLAPGAWTVLRTGSRMRLAAGWAAALWAVSLLLLWRQGSFWLSKGAAVAAGPLLGVFLLGLLRPARGDRAATAALASGALLNLGLLWLSRMAGLELDWGWLTFCGAAGAALAGWALSRGRR